MRAYLPISISLIVLSFLSTSLLTSSCAQIGMPDGGPKDTLAPKLIKATPVFGSLNVKNNKITLEFNEFVDVQDVQQNLIISPLQNKNPTITSNPKSITIKFKDTLLPNTTYTINFGDAVKDVNEGNVYKNLSYTFSTGNVLDSLSIVGRVIMAETGNIDSTLKILLYRNAEDSTVLKKKPSYIAKVLGDGSFEFVNLPAATFKIYALKDGDGSKTYNAKTEIFAFADADVNTSSTETITLNAYAEEKEKPIAIVAPSKKPSIDKKLKLLTNLQAKQDLLEPLEIVYNNPLKFVDSTKFVITDTNYKKITGIQFSQDSTSKKIILTAKWQADMALVLIIDTLAAKDSLGNKITKNDTIKFFTKRMEDYGKLTLRFNGLDLTKKPVIQFLNGEEVKYSYPIVNKEWNNNMFTPGEYGIRILYDVDKNGKWTPGNYKKRLQPETAVTLPQKLAVKADWDNERDINL
jgi:Bacterial Ig-like domain